ncbi:unnamed protein product [Meloidogyne enterolobii]|uniref:Uncharacterized protein n=1 Tax=Meloidogyne enterolobii TaxID=390850 RepID=A0ACB0YHT2_MELEN
MEESDFKKYSEEIDKLKEERRGLVELMNQMNQQLSKLDQKICDLEKKMEDEFKEKHGESSGGGKRKCEDTSTEAVERSVKKIRLDVNKESENVKEEVEDQGLVEVC